MKKYLLHIRHKVARFLFADEVAKIEMEREAFIVARKGHAKTIADFKKHAESLTVTDMVREQLAGFDGKTLDPITGESEDILDTLEESDDIEVFLSEAKSLNENNAFAKIATWLIRNQVLYSAKESETLESTNFGRASINGISLFKEEVERLAGVFEERHKKEEEYDEHGAI